MGNISTIFHKQFDKLFQLTNNYQQAVFLDKCIYWWQISKYTLNDNNIYFTRAYSQLADDVNISESSVNRYLKKFEDNGFIERKTKLSGCSKDEYKVIKRTYIRICDKLLNLLNTGSQKEEASITQKSSFCEQPDIIDNVTETVSIYKDKDFNTNTNFKVRAEVNVDKPQEKQDNQNTTYPSYPVEQIIGERINIFSKNWIKGAMIKLQTENQLKFSNPEQLFAEIVFSATNKDHFPGIDDFKNRISIICSLLRKKLWRTPKGFFNHCDYAGRFKSSTIGLDTQVFSEGEGAAKFHRKQKIGDTKTELRLLSQKIHSETSYLHTIRDSADARFIERLEKSIATLELEHKNLTQALDALNEPEAPRIPMNSNSSGLSTEAKVKVDVARLEQEVIEAFDTYCDFLKENPTRRQEADGIYDVYLQKQEALSSAQRSLVDLQEKDLMKQVA